jgi:hypothetical protein
MENKINGLIKFRDVLLSLFGIIVVFTLISAIFENIIGKKHYIVYNVFDDEDDCNDDWDDEI